MDAGLPELRRGQRWSLAILGLLVMALSFLDRQTLAVLAPTITHDLAIGNAQYGLIAAAFAFAHVAAAPLAGVVLGRIGVRRGLLAAVVTWSCIAAAHAFAAGFGSLLVLRALLGVAEAPGFPASAQIVRSALEPRDVARGMGLILTGGTLGGLAALVLSVPLQQRFGWRVTFAGVAALAALWLPLWAWLSSSGAARAALDVPRTEGPRGLRGFAHPQIVRVVVFTLGIAPVGAFGLLWSTKFLVARYGLAQGDVVRYGVLPSIAYDLGALAFGDFASRRRVSPRALLACACLLATSVAFLGAPQSPLGSMLVGSVAYFGVGGAFALAAAHALTGVDRAIVSRAGAAIAAANSLAFIVANPLIGWSIDRTGSYRPALVALALLVVPTAALWHALEPRPR